MCLNVQNAQKCVEFGVDDNGGIVHSWAMCSRRVTNSRPKCRFTTLKFIISQIKPPKTSKLSELLKKVISENFTRPLRHYTNFYARDQNGISSLSCTISKARKNSFLRSYFITQQHLLSRNFGNKSSIFKIYTQSTNPSHRLFLNVLANQNTVFSQIDQRF